MFYKSPDTEEYKDTFSGELIKNLLVNNKTSFQHNHLPYERAQYIQTLWHPFNPNQLITVSTVVRTNFYDPNVEAAEEIQVETNGSQPKPKIKTAKQKKEKEKPAKLSFGYPVKYEYIKLKSDGPGPLDGQHGDEEINVNVGSGVWTVNEMQQPQKPNLEFQEFLMLALWQFDEASNLLQCLMEVPIMNPILDSGNTRPLKISVQSKVIFWFEQEDTVIKYCHIELQGLPKITRTPVIGIQGFKDNFTVPGYINYFSRWNMGEDQILAYSHWENDECYLSFYSLNTRSELWRLPNMDTVLDFNPDSKEIWMLGQHINAQTQAYTDMVACHNFGDKKPLSFFHSTETKNFLKIYRNSTNPMECVLTKDRTRLVVLWSYSHVLVGDLQASTSQMVITHSESHKQLFLTGNSNTLYLVELLNRNMNKVTEPDDKRNGRLLFHDLSKPFNFATPTFEDYFRIDSNSLIKNKSKQQQIQISDTLQFKIALLTADLTQFSVNISNSQSQPVHPVHQHWAIKYPCIMMMDPRPMDKTLTLMNFLHPAKIFQLKLEDYRMVTFVEQHLSSEQTNVFTILAQKDKTKEMYIIQFTVHSFVRPTEECVTWKLYAKCNPLFGRQIKTDRIINVKLIRHKVKHQKYLEAIVIQYEQALIAVDLVFSEKRWSWVPEAKEVKPKVQNRNERFSVVFYDIAANDLYSFGIEICSPQSLVPKQILLGRHGECVYYMVHEKNHEVLMKVEHKPHLEDVTYQLEVVTNPLYKCFDKKVCFFSLDADLEQRNFISEQLDFFYLLDTSGFLVHLSQVKSKYFENKPHCEVLRKIDLNQFPKSQDLINNIQQRPWTMVATGEECFSWTNQTFGLSEHTKIKIPTVEKAEIVTWLRNVRDTQFLVGVCKMPTKPALNFFMKPNTHSKAIDCLGLIGPMTSFISFFGTDTIMYSWVEVKSKKPQTHIFNTNGKYCGQVKNPDGLEGFTPIQVSANLRYFLLQRIIGSTNEGYVASIKNNNGQFEWINNIESTKLFDLSGNRTFLVKQKGRGGRGGGGGGGGGGKGKGKGKRKGKGNKKKEEHSKVVQDLKEVPPVGELISVEFSYDESLQNNSVYAKCENQPNMHFSRYYIKFGDYGGKENFSKPRKVILQQNRLVIMGQNLAIIFFELDQVTENFTQLEEVQQIHLNLKTLALNNLQDKEFDIVPSPCLNFIQVSTPYNLITWSLRFNRQARELNGFKKVFDQVTDYIVTGFKIPYTYFKNDVQYIEFSAKQDFARSPQLYESSRIYRLYSELDLHKLQEIEKEIKDPDIKKLTKMDPKLIASTFESQTMFHLYHNNIQVVTGMIHALATKEAFDEVSKHAEEVLYKRTMLQLMRTNQSNVTAFNLAINKKNYQNFDSFLGFALRMQDGNISRQFLRDFTYVVGTSTENIYKFFDTKFCRNRSCELIEKVYWTQDSTEAILTSDHSIITREDIENITAKGFKPPKDEDGDGDDKAEDEDDGTQRFLFMNNQPLKQELSQEANEKMVDVMMLDFDWLFEDTNVQILIRMLEDTENDSLFATKQIKIFTEMLWAQFYTAIFYKMFLNFLRYFLSVVFYFTFFLGDDSGWGPGYGLGSTLLQVLIAVDILCVCAVEFVQAHESGFKNYLGDAWNWLDICSIGMNTLILVLNETYVDFHMIRQLAIFAVLMMWFKLFYWMRLFEATASFIRMTKEIFVDIKAFMVMLAIIVCTFANAFLIMDHSRRILGIEPITEDAFGNPILDTVTRAYMLGLGEYGTDTYELLDSKLAWALFIVATFLLQVTFFNLLIAIMGDTFDRVSEVKVQSALKEKLQMIGDHQGILDIQSTFAKQRYVFYVQQVSVAGQTSDAWEGRIGKLKNVINSQLKFTNKVIERKFDVIEQGLKKFEDEIKETINKLADTIKTESEKQKKIQQSIC